MVTFLRLASAAGENAEMIPPTFDPVFFKGNILHLTGKHL
jgi:hypothetical protein